MKLRPDLLHERSPRGLEVFQLTTEEKTPSTHVYMEAQIFTPDSKRLVLHRSCHPHGSDQNDPEHRYLLCDLVNGGGLSPLTNETGVTGPSVSPDGQWLYYFIDKTRLNGGSLTLKRVRLDGTQRETICAIDHPLPGTRAHIHKMYPLSTISSDGKRIATSGFLGDGSRANSPWGLLVIDIPTGAPRIILQGPSWCNLHAQYSRALDLIHSRDILIQENHGNQCDALGNNTVSVDDIGADIHVISDDGTNFRDLPWGRDGEHQCQGHQCWRGRGATAITTAGFLGRKLDVPNPDNWQFHEERIIEGSPAPHAAGHLGIKAPGTRVNDLCTNIAKPRFFHFATDAAGERFVTDCNPVRPNSMELWVARLGKPFEEPLQDWTFLLDMKTKFYDGGHPHPFLSPDGKMAFFNSTESGILQAYMVRGF